MARVLAMLSQQVFGHETWHAAGSTASPRHDAEGVQDISALRFARYLTY